MGYVYENSNPDRFQQFCQSLLILDRPNLQCFPIGQPDGGRDGWDPDTKTVLQVKFKRLDQDESADWIIKALEGELEKINRLIEGGAKEYILATNARGTAHLEAGRIDKVQSWLDENLTIPAHCYWRDELDRRLDLAPTTLKLKYSEILTLEDGIDVVLATILGPPHERSQSAIRAFLAWQYSKDETVKFKQVNLSNDLLELFIDVPVGIRRPNIDSNRRGHSGSSNIGAFLKALGRSNRSLVISSNGLREDLHFRTEGRPLRNVRLGAGELILSAAAQEHLKLIVLEGAPGQGKSTLAQFVCQVHRARYLNRSALLERVPDQYIQTAFRVPIKVDLRDFAQFLAGHSPFEGTGHPTVGVRSLEVFLAQLISYGSGGLEITVSDVLTLLRGGPVLLFLDGLDEVADIEQRQELVDSLMDTLNRLAEFSADIQVVVTSRPSVFGKAPAFGRLGFQTLSLDKLDRGRIFEYTDKWLIARGLEEDEKRDVTKILNEKLELAHIRDLTRNPMQLTILLSLIHQIGHSLPDQRTDLYRRYVDLFLTREADKSSGVRQHRTLLMGFIQHLAWVLQSQAESSRTSGSISASDLKEMVSEYLLAGSHSVALAQDLFSGGLERIFVLVERIEGLYEFEVQPLREYFCAQHLYATALVGTYRRTAASGGDRAQRFEAVAANPFWLNVSRFYAGSYASGEIGTLVLSLEEMVKTKDLPVALHARRVGVALLQDWVFSNKKFAQQKLIDVVFDELGVQTLICSGDRVINDDLQLDAECGQEFLRSILFERVSKITRFDRRSAYYCRTIRLNGGHMLRGKFTHLVDGTRDQTRTNLLKHMFRSGAAQEVSSEECWQLLTEDLPSRLDLVDRSLVVLGSETKTALACEKLVKELVSAALDGVVFKWGWARSSLGSFIGVLDSSGAGSLDFFLYRALEIGDDDGAGADSDASQTPEQIKDFMSVFEGLKGRAGAPYVEREREKVFQVWDVIAEAARRQFGEVWASRSIAIRSAGIRANVDVSNAGESMFDPSVAICYRARAARLRRGGESWWLRQLDCASSSVDRMFWLGLVLAWASVKNLYAMSAQVNERVDGLTPEEFGALRATLVGSAEQGNVRNDRNQLDPIDLEPFSNKAAVLVVIACNSGTTRLSLTKRLSENPPFSEWLSTRKRFEAVEGLPMSAWGDEAEAVRWLGLVNEITASGEALPMKTLQQLVNAKPAVQVARHILGNAVNFPVEAVGASQSVMQVKYKAQTLSKIAVEQDWSFE